MDLPGIVVFILAYSILAIGKFHLIRGGISFYKPPYSELSFAQIPGVVLLTFIERP